MRKRFLLVLGIISVLIALFLIVLHSPLVKSRILNTTLNYLKKRQGIELNFPPFLRAERIKLRLPPAFPGARVLCPAFPGPV